MNARMRGPHAKSRFYHGHHRDRRLDHRRRTLTGRIPVRERATTSVCFGPDPTQLRPHA